MGEFRECLESSKLMSLAEVLPLMKQAVAVVRSTTVIKNDKALGYSDRDINVRLCLTDCFDTEPSC